MTDIFERLESNDKETVENLKQSLREQFHKVNEPWLLNGLYEYYLNTNSVRSMEILIAVKEPHHTFLFDRLSDTIKSQNTEKKVQALTLLGHVARSQPTWLFKLQEHTLIKDLLRMLKGEVELLPLISSLLVVIVLLPIIPSIMGNYLKNIFEIFSRLASWNCSSGKSVEDQMIHMQVALYALFLRLYGMFPCNFLNYLKTQYIDNKNNPVFVHTIKPMLETVRMHPSLVTSSKDSETTTERWKKMGVHDVIVECERFSLDLTDRCPHDSCQYTSGFRSRSGTSNSTIETSYHLQGLKGLTALQIPSTESSFFTPSMVFHVQTPPVPETMPTNIPHPHVQNVLIHSSSSPFQEGTSPPEAAIEATPETTPIRVGESPFSTAKSKSIPTPSSPVSVNMSTRQFPMHQRVESPNNQSDEEIHSIVSKSIPLRQESLFHDLEDGTSNNSDEQEHGSPCTAGGLHMPNSKSMNNFAKRVQRLRYHSQCNPEPERNENSTGSSPGIGLPCSVSTTVRRAKSCPEIKKSPMAAPKDPIGKSLDETDEENVEKVNVKKTISNCPPAASKSIFTTITCSTQTENFWPMPYEHLFLGIFPSLENEIKPSPAPSPAPFNFTPERCSPPSIYDILDKYVEAAVNCNEKGNVPNLKDQLQLLHQHLLFERHRRETHAYRNRRLLSDAKSTRLLEECNSALRDTVQLKQKDIDDLRKQLEIFKRDGLEEERKLNRTIQYWEDQCKTLLQECEALKTSNNCLSRGMTDLNSKSTLLMREKQQAESHLLNACAEVNVAREQAWAGQKGRNELEQVNKELLLVGELQLKYQERLDQLSAMRRCEVELEEAKEAYKGDIRELNRRLELKSVTLEAHSSRITELERKVMENEKTLLQQKKIVKSLGQQRHEKLEAVESKYQTQLRINGALEEKIMDLRQRLEQELEKGKRNVHSPDTSSCHEVHVTTATGLSPHSSPLSASLASSEGSAVLHEREVRNLQAMVDQKEPLGMSKLDESMEIFTEDIQQPSSSTKFD